MNAADVRLSFSPLLLMSDSLSLLSSPADVNVFVSGSHGNILQIMKTQVVFLR